MYSLYTWINQWNILFSILEIVINTNVNHIELQKRYSKSNRWIPCILPGNFFIIIVQLYFHIVMLTELMYLTDFLRSLHFLVLTCYFYHRSTRCFNLTLGQNQILILDGKSNVNFTERISFHLALIFTSLPPYWILEFLFLYLYAWVGFMFASILAFL